jgi:hypothetical protein
MPHSAPDPLSPGRSNLKLEVIGTVFGHLSFESRPRGAELVRDGVDLDHRFRLGRGESNILQLDYLDLILSDGRFAGEPSLSARPGC